jgi:hypothetical protein
MPFGHRSTAALSAFTGSISYRDKEVVELWLVDE